MHLCRQWNCWSLRCSWSIACRRCSNYLFILDLIPGFNGLGKDNCKTRRESFKYFVIWCVLYYKFYGIHYWSLRAQIHLVISAITLKSHERTRPLIPLCSREFAAQSVLHEDVVRGKYFPIYWLSVKVIHWPTVHSPHKRGLCGVFVFSVFLASTSCRTKSRVV